MNNIYNQMLSAYELNTEQQKRNATFGQISSIERLSFYGSNRELHRHHKGITKVL